MTLGLGRLALSSDHFWQMTAFELLTALGLQHDQARALTRAEMEKLIKASGETIHARK